MQLTRYVRIDISKVALSFEFEVNKCITHPTNLTENKRNTAIADEK